MQEFWNPGCHVTSSESEGGIYFPFFYLHFQLIQIWISLQKTFSPTPGYSEEVRLKFIRNARIWNSGCHVILSESESRIWHEVYLQRRYIWLRILTPSSLVESILLIRSCKQVWIPYE